MNLEQVHDIFPMFQTSGILGLHGGGAAGRFATWIDGTGWLQSRTNPL